MSRCPFLSLNLLQHSTESEDDFHLPLTLASNHRFTFFFGCTGSWLLYRLSLVSSVSRTCPLQGPGFSLSCRFSFGARLIACFQFQEFSEGRAQQSWHTQASCLLAHGIFSWWEPAHVPCIGWQILIHSNTREVQIHLHSPFPDTTSK